MVRDQTYIRDTSLKHLSISFLLLSVISTSRAFSDLDILKVIENCLTDIEMNMNKIEYIVESNDTLTSTSVTPTSTMTPTTSFTSTLGGSSESTSTDSSTTLSSTTTSTMAPMSSSVSSTDSTTDSSSDPASNSTSDEPVSLQTEEFLFLPRLTFKHSSRILSENVAKKYEKRSTRNEQCSQFSTLQEDINEVQSIQKEIDDGNIYEDLMYQAQDTNRSVAIIADNPDLCLVETFQKDPELLNEMMKTASDAATDVSAEVDDIETRNHHAIIITLSVVAGVVFICIVVLTVVIVKKKQKMTQDQSRISAEKEATKGSRDNCSSLSQTSGQPQQQDSFLRRKTNGNELRQTHLNWNDLKERPPNEVPSEGNDRPEDLKKLYSTEIRSLGGKYTTLFNLISVHKSNGLDQRTSPPNGRPYEKYNNFRRPEGYHSDYEFYTTPVHQSYISWPDRQILAKQPNFSDSYLPGYSRSRSPSRTLTKKSSFVPNQSVRVSHRPPSQHIDDEPGKSPSRPRYVY